MKDLDKSKQELVEEVQTLRSQIKELKDDQHTCMKVEADLRENQRVLSALLGNLPGMAYRCRNDRSWTMTFVSQGCMDLTGYQPNELIENSQAAYGDLIHPEDRARVWQHIQASLENRERFQVTYRIIAADGRQKWVWEQGTGIFSEDGDVLALEGIVTDISERVQAEEALRESEERYRTLFENAPIGLGLADSEGNLLGYNTAMLAPGEYASEDITEIGNVQNLYFDLEERNRALALARDQGYLSNFEIRFKRKDGSPYVALLSLTPVTIEGQRCWQAMVEDVTQQKRAQDQIQRQLQNMAALRAIDLAITSSMDLRLIFDVLLNQITAVLEVDAATILIYNAHIQTLDYAASRGFRSAALQHTHLRLGAGNAGQAALERRTIHIPDLQTEDTTFSRSPYLEAEYFRAYFGVPLIAKGQIKGVLEIFHRTSLSPDQEWLDVMEALAGQAAIAIDNAELFKNLQQSNQELLMAYEFTLEGWAKALELRDAETEGHTQRVTDLTVRLARAMGMSEEELVHVRRGTRLHDIGKMGIPDSILLKPGPLSEAEWQIMRQHPVYAYQLLAPIPFLRPAMDIPYGHHERWDGSGYPQSLKGEQIPLAARIFAVVDVWDALGSQRPYREAWPEAEVYAYLEEQAGKQFDPEVVKAFLELQGRR